ncbi:hypothetical protein AWRIB318_1385 [Oenococcus oeni AWRIB318]|nr:hypothetical protein AWRIB318_1385 [Oenococcus oeni AWRIB318]
MGKIAQNGAFLSMPKVRQNVVIPAFRRFLSVNTMCKLHKIAKQQILKPSV